MPARPVATIGATITSDLNDLRELFPLLEQQAQSLRSRDMGTIPVLAQSISSLTQKLDASARKRAEALVALGHGTDREGMQQFLQTCSVGEYEAVNTQWQELIELTRKCKKLNASNGQLLQMQKSLTDTMLKRLNRDVDNVGYAPDGSDGRLGESTSLGYA